MPTKFRPSEIIRVKGQGTKTNHYYIKNMTSNELLEYVNSNNAIPKRRLKCINELQSRKGITLVHAKELSLDGKKVTKTVSFA